MRRIRRALILGLVTGVVGLVAALVSSISELEDTFGLRWLFHVRGPVPPSDSVAVVSIDEGSAPRAVAFDIEFVRHSADPAEDARLAGSIAGAGRREVPRHVR